MTDEAIRAGLAALRPASRYDAQMCIRDRLSDETREMAIRKLDHMSIHVGYPDEARPMYALLKPVPASEGGTLVDNMMAYTLSLIHI